MKKSIIVSIMVMIIVFSSINIVSAATNKVNLTASNTTVKQGETFTVTLSAECEDGINGIDTTYDYDKNKLELVNANVSNNNWASMGTTGTIQVICNNTQKITSDNIYVLTFKVRDNAVVGATSISTSGIKLDSDVSASSFTDEAKSVSININSKNPNTPNGNNNQTTQDTTTVKNPSLPKTGAPSYVWIIFVCGILCAIVSYCLIRIKQINKK